MSADNVMAHRLTLLLSTPRIAPGLFTRDAWTALANAVHVFTRDEDETQLIAIQESGIAAVHLGEQSPAELARLLIDRTVDGEVVWIGSADGDPGLTDALATEVTLHDDAPEVEVIVGSFDVPGARLLDLVAVMDRLRSLDGCPWDAEQTHESLVPYLIEETHELVEAIESGDRTHMAEELGDVLLQVAFHARMAQEHPDSPFGIDDVAAGIVDKLVRRHPHVFADVDAEDGAQGDASTAEDVAASWEQIKADEKPHRSSPMDGIPDGLPALARADKVAARLTAAGRLDLAQSAAVGDDLGSRLFALVLEARENGQDSEAALRTAVRAVAGQL
ncbi:MAG: MazG family protein [Dermatophilaceae bacterium]